MKSLIIFGALVAAVTAQLPGELPSTCASTSCIALAGVECKEVYNQTSGIITGQCLTNPRATSGVCGSAGQTLFTYNQSDVALEAFCGRGPSRMECPAGYECNIAPNDAYAVCCPRPSVGPTTKSGQCPVPSGGSFGICASTCSDDSGCPGSQKCCRNECGATTCQTPLDEQPISPCAAMLCQAGTRCEERPVQCIRAPCPPQAACVPIERDGVCPDRRPYSWWGCPRAQRCSMDGNCPGAQKCCQYSMGCGTVCMDPVPCNSTSCPSQAPHCVRKQVQCFAPPCYPVPTCVTIDNACEPACRPGYKCQMATGRCGFAWGTGWTCERRPRCVQEPVCRPTCGPDYECKWQRSNFCFWGNCPLQARCVLKPRCPFYPAWVNPNCLRTDECDLNNPNACPEGTLCCSTDCGRKCVRPL